MTIIWDQIGSRQYEAGIDRGVLYLPSGLAVPWNGLISVDEKAAHKTEPVFFDGMKIHDSVTSGAFSASLTAITYPDEFSDLEGYTESRRGLLHDDQPLKTFGFSYRTKVGTDNDSEAGYKIHLVYNVTAIPSNVGYNTLTDQSDPILFSWDLHAVPEVVPGYKPTAHFVINSLTFDPMLLEQLEDILYGTELVPASLMPLPDLIQFLNDWYRFRVQDNGDGTWTAVSDSGQVLEYDGTEPSLELIKDQVIAYFDPNGVVQLRDTRDLSEVKDFYVFDNGDGTWFATTFESGYIFVDVDESFEIHNANVIFIDEDTYIISDAP